MADFTSSLYLGLQHPTPVLQPWRELTTGVPAALREPVEARTIALTLARLQGLAAGALARSTLHLAWDVFGLLTRQPVTVHMDAGSYPISRWGAALRGVEVREFSHRDPRALRRQLEAARPGTRPVVVTDGFCPACGRSTPLNDYLASVRAHGGWLFVDDTQALGILGRNPSPELPYGRGGGGSLRWQDIRGSEIVVVASLAKAFGVPLAVVAGSAEFIEQFRADGDTRVHCSPPSAADLAAATHALSRNQTDGDHRRQCLADRVRQFRRGLAEIGIIPSGGLFPLQTMSLPPDVSETALQSTLRRLGIQALLLRGEDDGPRLGFLIRASHSAADIRHAVGAIAQALGRVSEHFIPYPRADLDPSLTLNQRN